MERLEKRVARFMQVTMQAHVLADFHHVRFNMEQRFDVLEHRLKAIKIGVDESGAGGGGAGIELGKKKVKEMLMGDQDRGVFEICGIGGSGKTTLAKEICKDDKVKSYFKDRIFFFTVSQSPNVEQLRKMIWEKISGCNLHGYGYGEVLPQWNLQYQWNLKSASLVLLILDDVWSLSVLEPLIFKIPGCKILVVSHIKFPPSIIDDCIYDLELLREDEAMSLFCHFAFGHNSFPRGFNQKLVKEVVDECEGLPLALKVIGSSLKGKPKIFWASAKNRLSQSQLVCESHELQLLERMKLSIDCLPEKLHDIDEEEAFHILVELSDKNLLNLVKDARAGDIYTSYYEISVSQHDVLRDLAIHMSNRDDNHFLLNADEMREMDWFRMDCPKAEVLILNFASSEYFFPPFLENMPKLRALIIINYSASNTVLHNILDKSVVDLLGLFPQLSEFTMDHCINFNRLPSSICRLHKLNSLSITNCDNLNELPSDLGELQALQVLRIYACPHLKRLPPGIGHLVKLRYLDISQCVGLRCLPEAIGCYRNLEKIDMRECPQIESLPSSLAFLESLRCVICDDEVFCQWKDVEKAVPGLCVQVAEE
ncbi:hypothetical protein RND71_031535 [Anisodus tanguticus]|uniref:Disease resistance protein n=1 Tax=Anisodus tanguticus TaxID=243964 RepID=A0AAE1RBV6_9SOLA|nr:hypothetical protein RND71_031535 [Anisodus tanguticus]